jgi:hypothetical protein
MNPANSAHMRIVYDPDRELSAAEGSVLVFAFTFLPPSPCTYIMGDILATHWVLPILSVRSQKTILPLFVVFVAVSSCSCEV